jgi:hypothetical protein
VLTTGTTSGATARPGGTTAMIGASPASRASWMTLSSIVRSPMRACCLGEPKRVEAPAARITAAMRIGSL